MLAAGGKLFVVTAERVVLGDAIDLSDGIRCRVFHSATGGATDPIE